MAASSQVIRGGLKPPLACLTAAHSEAETVLEEPWKRSPELDVGATLHAAGALLDSLEGTAGHDVHHGQHEQDDKEDRAATQAVTVAATAAASSAVVLRHIGDRECARTGVLGDSKRFPTRRSAFEIDNGSTGRFKTKDETHISVREGYFCTCCRATGVNNVPYALEPLSPLGYCGHKGSGTHFHLAKCGTSRTALSNISCNSTDIQFV